MFGKAKKSHRGEAPPASSGWGTAPNAKTAAPSGLPAVLVPDAAKSDAAEPPVRRHSRATTPPVGKPASELPPPSTFDTPKAGAEVSGTIAAAAAGASCPRWVAVDLETSGFSDMANHIIEMGAWAIVDGEERNPPESLSLLCKPDADSFGPNDAIGPEGPTPEQMLRRLDMHPMAVKKHAFEAEEIVRDGTPLTAALQRLIAVIIGDDDTSEDASTCLVFHNAPFDTRFLQTATAPRKAVLAQHFVDASPARFKRAMAAINTLSRTPGLPAAELLPVCCTQALFRQLFPRQPYDLDSALRFVGAAVRRETSIHRAAEDAHLTVLLFRHLSATAADVVETANEATTADEPAA